MTTYHYGASPDLVSVDAATGRPRTGVSATFFDAESGGSQDLTIVDSLAGVGGAAISGAFGRWEFTSDTAAELWLDTGTGVRWLVRAQESYGPTGATGATGPASTVVGPIGPAGPAGGPVPVGGTDGQVVAKSGGGVVWADGATDASMDAKVDAERVTERAHQSSTYVAADQDVVDDFNRADGGLGNALTGQVWGATGSSLPAIVGGAMTSVGVGYAYVVLPAKVHSFGADFTFSAGTTGGVAALLISGSNTALDLNNMGLHLQINPVSWVLQVRVAGETPFPALASGTFPVPLAQDGTTRHRVNATIEGNTATVSLPDGQGVTVTDARIGAQCGQVPCWEVFTGGGAAQASFHAVWATKVGNPPTRRAGLASDRDLAKVAARVTPGTLLAEASYAVAYNINATATYINVDGVTVTVVVPPSGKVLVRILAPYILDASGVLMWNLREGGTDIAGTNRRIVYNTAGNQQGTGVYEARLDGLTPGSTHTYQFGFAQTNGAVNATISADAGIAMGPAQMSVFAR